MNCSAVIASKAKQSRSRLLPPGCVAVLAKTAWRANRSVPVAFGIKYEKAAISAGYLCRQRQVQLNQGGRMISFIILSVSFRILMIF